MKRLLEEVGGGDPLLAATLLYLSTLAPDLADAAFRGAILRWFDAEVLGQVLGAGSVSSLGASATATGRPPDELDRRLQDLPFVEPFPGRGHSFHERTRKALLDHLWHKERVFYREVSARARDYFQGRLDRQIKSDEDGEPDLIQGDQDLVVEILYHDAIANESEAEAIRKIDALIDERLIAGQLSGICHALILAVSEHGEAGRPTPAWKEWVKYWQHREAYEAFDLAQCAENTRIKPLPPRPKCWGRDREIERLVASLLAEGAGPTWLVGGPGMGKSTAVLAALHAPLVLERFGERRLYARCESARARAGIIARIAKALGLQPDFSPEEQVIRELGKKSAALVLNNLESALADDPGATADLLRRLSDVKPLSLIVVSCVHPDLMFPRADLMFPRGKEIVLDPLSLSGARGFPERCGRDSAPTPTSTGSWRRLGGGLWPLS